MKLTLRKSSVELVLTALAEFAILERETESPVGTKIANNLDKVADSIFKQGTTQGVFFFIKKKKKEQRK